MATHALYNSPCGYTQGMIQKYNLAFALRVDEGQHASGGGSLNVEMCSSAVAIPS